LFLCSKALTRCIAEFEDLNVYEATKILRDYYKVSGNFVNLNTFFEADAKRNFTTPPEMVRRIIRKHYGLPEFTGRKLYHKDKIDEEINRRIQVMIAVRVGRKRQPRGEIGIRKMILKSALTIQKPRDCSQKDLDNEIKKRSEFTGLSVEEVKRKLYCAYFNIGVVD
jgi:hypothetical protein